LACESFEISTEGLAELIATLADTGTVIDRIGVEGSSALGRPVVLALTAAGYDVREVQASRTNDRRRRRHRAKTDITDAQAIAAETLTDPGLPPAGKHAAEPPPHGRRCTPSAPGVNPLSCNESGTSPRPSPC